MLEIIKEKVYLANIDLVNKGLVILTWGNASERDKNTGHIVIKPSGIPYEAMKIDDMVIVDIAGQIVEGNLRPSSDLKTHLEIYKEHPEINGIVHTHSTYACAYAQAGESIAPYGTTHADYFHGDILCTRPLTKDEIESDYELNTGIVINETISINALENPGVIVNQHGMFTFGKDVNEAVDHALVLEKVAEIAFLSKLINPNIMPVNQFLLDKHYYRKHGAHAYYGQSSGGKK